MKEEALKLADAMEGRAEIRRQAKDRLSVQEGANDRLSDQLEQGAITIRNLIVELEETQYNLKSLSKKYSALVAQPFNFYCGRCGKKLSQDGIHTCTPPKDIS